MTTHGSAFVRNESTRSPTAISQLIRVPFRFALVIGCSLYVAILGLSALEFDTVNPVSLRD
jgi:hypothetical protein